MAKKSVGQRLIEFGGWLISHVPPWLPSPLIGLNYTQCQAAEPGFDAYMADAFAAWEFDAADIASFKAQFVFPS